MSVSQGFERIEDYLSPESWVHWEGWGYNGAPGFPAANLQVPFPLHLSLIDAQDITLFALCDVWHSAVLSVIVVGSVLGMLLFNKFCEENTYNSMACHLKQLGG